MKGAIDMQPRAKTGGRVVGAMTAIAALGLLSCGDSKGEPTISVSGGGNGGAGTSGGVPGTSGSFAAGGASGSRSEGGTFSSGAATGQAAAGSGGNTGGGGSTVVATAGGGGSPSVRPYTISGCVNATAGGAGGADSGAGGDGPDNAGGTAVAAAGAGGDGEAGGESSVAPSGVFASFTLYDCMTDKPVQTCVDKTIDFNVTVTGAAPLTVVANVAPGAGPGSVIFTYDGVPQLAHNLYPYALGDDDNGDFYEPNPQLAPGAHTISIAAYELEDGLGKVLGRASVVLTVIDDGP
jgi:hypothetical protein